MTCQSLLFREKKMENIVNLSSAELAKRVLKNIKKKKNHKQLDTSVTSSSRMFT